MNYEIEIKGEYVYLNKHTIKFDSEEQAQEFLLKMIKEGLFD